ncbi:MAG: hypothetical protein RSC00_06430, partial [Ruthenibacterium sp.]
KTSKILRAVLDLIQSNNVKLRGTTSAVYLINRIAALVHVGFFTALAQKSFALLYTKQTKLKKALCRRNFAGREPFLIREI